MLTQILCTGEKRECSSQAWIFLYEIAVYLQINLLFLLFQKYLLNKNDRRSNTHNWDFVLTLFERFGGRYSRELRYNQRWDGTRIDLWNRCRKRRMLFWKCWKRKHHRHRIPGVCIKNKRLITIWIMGIPGVNKCHQLLHYFIL